MDKARIEQLLLELPLFQYDWMETSELVFSERVRWICQTQCPMYNTTWACPPAVGTVEECKARCLSYPHALMMTSTPRSRTSQISKKRLPRARRTRS